MCLNSRYFHARASRQAGFWVPPLQRLLCALLLTGLNLTRAHAAAVAFPNPDGTVDTWAGGLAPYFVNGVGVVNLVPYHPQVTAYFCGAATMEMTMDCDSVRNNNQVADTMLGAGVAGADPGTLAVDGATRNINFGNVNWQPAQFQIFNFGNGNVSVPTFGVQSFMYGLVHNVYTYNGLLYNNPWAPNGQGTTLDQMSAGLNLMDSPANNAGIHNYVSYNLPPSLLGRDYANRTMAYCIKQYGIPAAAIVQHGGHWFCVVGVKTTAPPVLNGPYKIKGFYIHDPWSGFYSANENAILAQFGRQPGIEGMGENRYFTYAVNPARAPSEWDDEFNLSPGAAPLPFYASGVGFKFEVEPVGPAPVDTGNNGEYNSIPDPSPTLPNAPLGVAAALVIATNDIAGDAYISSQTGFNDGGWDPADATVVQYPTDTPGEGDWLIPYDGSGGTNDVTGFVLIDMQTGNLDEAVWMDPGDTVTSMTLSDMDEMETDEFAGNYLDDNIGSPDLAIESVDTNSVLITWPVTTFANYTLQQNSDLTTQNWVTVTNPVTEVDDTYEVLLPTSGAQSFFRLYSGPTVVTTTTDGGTGKLPN